LIVVTGAQGGVGATTLAVNLAVAMADQGARSVLVDADLYHADVAALCGLIEQASVIDVLAARRDIHEVLRLGPAGVQVIPGARIVANPGEFTESAQRRLLRQIRSLGPHADVVIVDCGGGANQVVQRFWAAADVILLVVTPEATSMMDAYADIKRVSSEHGKLAIGLLVNRVVDGHVAEQVYRRIDSSCRRFLGFGVAFLGHISEDAQVPAVAAAGRPFVLAAPDCAASKALDPLARQLVRGSGTAAIEQRDEAVQARISEAEEFVSSSPAVADFGR